MGGEPARHAHDLPADPVGDRRGIMQDHGRGHDQVERLVGERQAFAAAEQQVDVAVAAQEPTGLVELGRAEIDAHQGDVEPAPQFASSFP